MRRSRELLDAHKPRWEQGWEWRCACNKTFAPDDFEGYWRHLPLSEPLDVERPRIVCLCGSTRFYSAFQRANYEETMAGRIVLSVGFYPHSSPEAHGEAIGVTPEQKAALDELHLRKINLADEVLVLNQGGYIGESTRREIAHAEATGKLVRYLEPLTAEVGR